VCYKGIYTAANKHVTSKQKEEKNISFPLVHDGLFFLISRHADRLNREFISSIK
jgi:hypothetical protein